MSSIDEIKARIDILDLAAEAGVKLRRAGRNYSGFCPFHDNKRTPAFVIWPETGTWRCFGECNEGGDIFKFMMKKEGVDFKDALQRLAEKAGVTLERLQPERPEQREENERLRNLLEDAAQFYRHQLLNTPAGKSSLTYLLEKRGLTMQTIETWGLGYAPQGYENALKHFTAKGYSEQDQIDAGLLSIIEDEGQARRVFDRFRHRIMIPIRDENGRMTGFGARIHPDDPKTNQAKFINTSETPLFSKGRLLYGLDRARKPIRAADQVVIVEGYLDVIAVHQAGYENIVSPMGTALTEDQLRLLKRFTRKIVLALDPDTAGQKAVLRGLDAAREAMDREGEIRFDARGLLRHEARLQADLRVASMPDDLDPDEIVARDCAEWARLIEAAKPIVEHVLDVLIAERDVNNPKAKTDIVSQMIPLIEDLPNPVERDSYRQLLARRLKVDERSLTGVRPGERAIRPAPRPQARQAQVQESAPARSQAHISPYRKMEATCIGMLLRRPDLLPRLDRRLQEAGLSALGAADFEYTDYQSLLLLIQRSLEQDEADTAAFVLARLVDELSETHKELLGLPAPKGTDDRLLDDLTRQVLQMRRIVMAESVNQLRFLAEENQAGELNQTALKYARVLQAIDQARKRLSEYRRE